MRHSDGGNYTIGICWPVRQSHYVLPGIKITKGVQMGDTGVLDTLRRSLANGLREHPPSTWSPQLLAVVTNAIEIEFSIRSRAVDIPRGRPRLAIVQ